MLKRSFDVMVALAGLIFFAPALLVIALLVKLDSPGPVFYRGERVGKDGRHFGIYKIRTMRVDAGPPLTTEDDPRITGIGHALRRSRLDEIPQLLNVLKGEMSLVGPTPEDPYYVRLYTPEQLRVLSVRPGLTSPAALAFLEEERILALGRGDATYTSAILPVKLDLDLAYVRRQSFVHDLAILARTIALLFPKHFVAFRRIANSIRRRVPRVLIDAAMVALGYYSAFLFHSIEPPAGPLRPGLARLSALMLPLVVLYVSVNYCWQLHRRVWRYPSVPEALPVLASAASSTAIVAILDLTAERWHFEGLPLTVVLGGGILTFCGFVAVRFPWGFMNWILQRTARREPRTRALIYGAGEAGQLLAWQLLSRKEGRAYKIVGFLDDDRAKRGLRVHGIEVLGNRFDLARIVESKRVEMIILAITNITGEKRRAIISAAQETTAQIRIAPGIFDWMSHWNGIPLVREVRVEDLLGRQPVSIDRPACQRLIGHRVVLVTGACGSIGAELCRQIAGFAPERLVVLDNNETGSYDLEIELRAKSRDMDLRTVVGDITDEQKIEAVFAEFRPQLIFHVAAYKHVPLMEQYPEEAVRVNIGGTWTVLRSARKYGTERFVLVSTDKAVNPSSVMGATKRVAELLVIGEASGRESKLEPAARLLCTAVRFGNVLGSRGSVVPTFAKQIELGGPVTVTHPEMTRYFMEIAEAASLIIQAAGLTANGDIFMLDMGERMRIDDLARKMIRMRGLRPEIDVPIVYSGMRPGEKLHEELTYQQEDKLPTGHRLIHRVRDRARPDRTHVEQAVANLLHLAATGKREQLVQELARLSRSGAAREPVGHVRAN